MIAIIERAMQLDPAKRFPDMRAMGRELLGLAGQRTRITWGLSFSEISQSAAGVEAIGAPLPAALPRRESSRPPPASKNRYALPVALVALAAGVAIWMNWPKPEGQVALNVSNHPASEDTRKMELRGRSAAEAPAAAPEQPSPAPAALPIEQPVAERVAQGLNEPIGALHGESAPESPKEPVAAVNTPKAEEKPVVSRRTLALNPPRARTGRLSGSRRPSASTRPASSLPVATPVSTSAAPGSDGEPDWVISSRGQGAQGHGPDRGTNNAPILD
jgi:hypothetical protein